MRKSPASLSEGIEYPLDVTLVGPQELRLARAQGVVPGAACVWCGLHGWCEALPRGPSEGFLVLTWLATQLRAPQGTTQPSASAASQFSFLPLQLPLFMGGFSKMPSDPPPADDPRVRICISKSSPRHGACPCAEWVIAPSRGQSSKSCVLPSTC